MISGPSIEREYAQNNGIATGHGYFATKPGVVHIYVCLTIAEHSGSSDIEDSWT